jgi:glycosyltransferase involved in cell wall biosynthesis
MKSVLVSVLITAYNEEEKIERCLNSILSQTFQNFEIVLINDGSTDCTDMIVQKLISEKDNQHKIVYINRENKGRLRSLNEGLFLAKGKYIAIQDADDYSLPQRLEKQVSVLEKHPEIGVLGTAYIRLDSIRYEKYVRSYPTTDKKIKKEMCKYIPICQGSVMYRTELIRKVGGYNEECKDAEDLDLWLRIGNKTKFANISEAYYVYDLTMQNSYFHSNYRIWDRNKRVFKLNCKAVRVFKLPFYYYIYPVARLIYPYIPNGLKKIARTIVSDIKENEG